MPLQCSRGSPIVEVSLGGAGSKEGKPARCGWAQEALQRTWPWLGSVCDMQVEGGGTSVPKEQVKRPRGRRGGGRRALDGCGGAERCIPRQEMG